MMTETKQQLPKFTGAERNFIKAMLADGFEHYDILKAFKAKLYPNNGYCESEELKAKFIQRIYSIKSWLFKDNKNKLLASRPRAGLAVKAVRERVLRNKASSVLYLLTDYQEKILEKIEADPELAALSLMSDEDWKKFKECNELFLKQLKELAIHQGEYKTTSPLIDMSDRRQLQQVNVFGGQATVPHLEGDNATGLRIVAPSVEQSKHTGGSLDPPQQTNSVSRERYPVMPKPALDASKEVEQPPEDTNPKSGRNDD